MLKGDCGSKWLAIQTHYVCTPLGLLQIMLPLANTDLGSSLERNLSIHVVNTQSNQDNIFFTNMVDSMATEIREETR